MKYYGVVHKPAHQNYMEDVMKDKLPTSTLTHRVRICKDGAQGGRGVVYVFLASQVSPTPRFGNQCVVGEGRSCRLAERREEKVSVHLGKTWMGHSEEGRRRRGARGHLPLAP